MHKIKIIYLITELSIGGAQNALTRLLSGLDRASYEPYVACLYNGDGVAAESIRQLGIPVTDLGMKFKRNLGAFFRIYRLLRKVKPDILHTLMFHANIPGRIIGRLTGVPIIISSERTMEMESRFRLWLNQLTAHLADRITCVSQKVADFAIREIKIPQEKIIIIPNGISMDQYSHIRSLSEERISLGLPEGLLIGTVSRAHPIKGLAILLDAFAMLLIDRPQVHLVLVGSGPQLHELQQQANKLGLEGHVIFLGERRDIPSILAAIDIFVLPSLFEGMPNAVLEAMASGLPVVATSVGGTPEVIMDGVTGLLVPPGNPTALTNAMVRLLEDPGLRSEMGQAAYMRVKQYYTQEQMVQKTELLYQDLMALR